MFNGEALMATEETGCLFLQDVLFAYIYPRIFVCANTNGEKYMFYEVSSHGNKDVWLVVEIEDEEYCDVIEKRKSIQQVYEEKESPSIFTITKTYENDADIEKVTFDAKEWIGKLPEAPVFADKNAMWNLIRDDI